METINQILEVLTNSNGRYVLATIIHVVGSAYRKEGSSMLFGEDGSRVGILSGGCLEEDLAERVKEILESGIARSFVYNLNEGEEGWGGGSGCGGVIHVLLEPVNNLFLNHLCTLKLFLERDVPVLVAKRFEDDGSVSEYVYIADDFQFGTWQMSIPSEVKTLQTNVRPLERKSGTRFISELSSKVYVHYYWPKPRLFIFGAGPDAPPLAEMAAQTGFSVTLSDWRPAYLNRNYYPSADRLLLGFPSEICDHLIFSPTDFVMIMTHHFKRDKELLDRLMKRELRYVGLLGSRNRTWRLLEGANPPSWIHSPAGLPIAADGPEEIAVSIMAEIIQTLRCQPLEPSLWS